MQAGGRYFDGQTPRAQEVGVELDDMGLLLTLPGGEPLARWPLADLTLLGTPGSDAALMIGCRIEPGARLLIQDEAMLKRLAELAPALRRLNHRKSRTGPTLVALIAALAVLVGAGFVVALEAPQLLAPLVPRTWQEKLGDEALDLLAEKDGLCTGETGQAALDRLVAQLAEAAPEAGDLRVVVIDHRLVNAFALPGGRLAIFRGLLAEADGPDEVSGVLAHEIGHAVHNHPMQGFLRQLGLSAFRRMVLGGYGDAAELAGGLGESVFAMRYSRAAEREADATALAILERAGLRQDGLSRFFAKLQKAGSGGDGIPAILSTHPPLTERQEATARSTAGRPALSEADWQALLTICGEAIGKQREKGREGKREGKQDGKQDGGAAK